MKIQPINNSTHNNKNISHKAFFKPNDTFNNFFGKYGKGVTKETIAKFQKVPDHRLEMIATKNFENGFEIDIFNTFTQKAMTFGVTKKNPLESLLNQIASGTTEDFFTKDSLNSTNYLSLTMPALFKKF